MKFWQFSRWGIGSLIIIYIFYLWYNQAVKESIANNYSTQYTKDFTLTDQYGVERSISEFRGKYILIYFGYTSCNGICYKMLQTISQALNSIDANSEKIILVFVTIHPERDTVENLKTYAKCFNHKFIMMTGTSEQVEAVLKQYKIYRLKMKPDETMLDSLIEHSSLAYFLDQDGTLIKFFDQNITPTNLANEIRAYIQ